MCRIIFILGTIKTACMSRSKPVTKLHRFTTLIVSSAALVLFFFLKYLLGEDFAVIQQSKYLLQIILSEVEQKVYAAAVKLKFPHTIKAQQLCLFSVSNTTENVSCVCVCIPRRVPSEI